MNNFFSIQEQLTPVDDVISNILTETPPKDMMGRESEEDAANALMSLSQPASAGNPSWTQASKSSEGIQSVAYRNRHGSHLHQDSSANDQPGTTLFSGLQDKSASRSHHQTLFTNVIQNRPTDGRKETFLSVGLQNQPSSGSHDETPAPNLLKKTSPKNKGTGGDPSKRQKTTPCLPGVKKARGAPVISVDTHKQMFVKGASKKMKVCMHSDHICIWG